MFDNRNSEAGRSVGPSSAQLGALRRTWADAGRQAWDKATRTGQNVLARTQSELEALGRRELARVEALAQAGGQAIAKVAKATYDVIGGPVSLAGRMSRAGTDADPGPGLLVAEFATGRGPQRRVLEPSSSLSREYVRAPSVQGHLRNAIGNWRGRDGGQGRYTNYDTDFFIPEAIADICAGNGATNVIGSARLDAERRGDRIDWSATNKMGLNSGFSGNPLSKIGLSGVPDASRPGPFGSTRQVIRFTTDLHGNPIGASSGKRGGSCYVREWIGFDTC